MSNLKIQFLLSSLRENLLFSMIRLFCFLVIAIGTISNIFNSYISIVTALLVYSYIVQHALTATMRKYLLNTLQLSLKHLVVYESLKFYALLFFFTIINLFSTVRTDIQFTYMFIMILIIYFQADITATSSLTSRSKKYYYLVEGIGTLLVINIFAVTLPFMAKQIIYVGSITLHVLLTYLYTRLSKEEGVRVV